MKDIALITLHGMGKEKPTYFSDLEDGLKRKLGSDWARISFQTVQYAPILQEPQDQLWRDIITTSKNDIDSTRLRQFFLYGFGDAGSLEYSAHNGAVNYLKVQEEIQSAISSAYIELGQDKGKSVVIIAQSLGCQVISNYLWDAENSKYIFETSDGTDPDKDEFLRLKSLRSLVTTGCNIPLFVGGISERKCFGKPNDQFRWDNYYDPDDVLGWPLSQLGDSFEMINDHHVNVGGVFSSWNVASHGKYWSDNDVINPLANVLKDLLA